MTLAALSTAFCAVALAVCAGLLSRAWAEQEELQHYRAAVSYTHLDVYKRQSIS